MKKTFEIDWDDPSDIKKHSSLLLCRRKKLLQDLGYSGVSFSNSKYHCDTFLPVLNEMYDSDFTHLYEDSSAKKAFYVYAHCNPLKKLHAKHDLKHLFLALRFPLLTHEPFYIGKGYGDRFLDFNRNDSHRKIRQQLLKSGKDLLPVKLEEKLNEAEALNKESHLIDILGLLCYKGILTNLDEGERATERRRLYRQDEKNYVKKILQANGFK
jgi:hypothetical protein